MLFLRITCAIHFARIPAFGPWRTWTVALHMSAFMGKVDYDILPLQMTDANWKEGRHAGAQHRVSIYDRTRNSSV